MIADVQADNSLMNRPQIADILTKLLAMSAAAGVSENEVARKTGVNQPTINRIKAGASATPQQRNVHRLAAYYGLAPAQLRGDEKIDWADVDQRIKRVAAAQAVAETEHIYETNAAPSRLQARAWDERSEIDPQAFVWAPFYNVDLGAGHGANGDEHPEQYELPFRRYWLRSVGVSPENVAIVRVRGRSMEPTLRDGCVVAVDRGRRLIEDGNIYAIRIGEDLRVKRLQKRYDGALLLISDNRDEFESETIPAYDLNQIEIIGRVFWQAGVL